MVFKKAVDAPLLILLSRIKIGWDDPSSRPVNRMKEEWQPSRPGTRFSNGISKHTKRLRPVWKVWFHMLRKVSPWI